MTDPMADFSAWCERHDPHDEEDIHYLIHLWCNEMDGERLTLTLPLEESPE